MWSLEDVSVGRSVSRCVCLCVLESVFVSQPVMVQFPVSNCISLCYSLQLAFSFSFSALKAVLALNLHLNEHMSRISATVTVEQSTRLQAARIVIRCSVGLQANVAVSIGPHVLLLLHFVPTSPLLSPHLTLSFFPTTL
jgi:hypothetical protein